MSKLEKMGLAAREAARACALTDAAAKNAFLESLAHLLEASVDKLCAANAEDLCASLQAGLPQAMLDRLRLTPQGVADLAAGVRCVAKLKDPTGTILEDRLLENGLRIIRQRVPLGVVAAVYESRPNVTVDIAALCLKTGNAVILRGGKESLRSNTALIQLIRVALEESGLPAEAAQFIDDPDRALLLDLLRLERHVDMLIPRGGPALQRFCLENARMPVINGGIGVCHIFVDRSARTDLALPVLANAKIQRPSACNSMETALIHQEIAPRFIPELVKNLGAQGVTFHCDAATLKFFPPGVQVKTLAGDELDQEWLSLDMNIVSVRDLDEAIAHIHRHGSGHSEAILTEDQKQAEYFVRHVDAAAIYVNASTRFTDGGEFGLGAEVAISTQKTHARGPMGLEALTSCKWIGYGQYTVRK